MEKLEKDPGPPFVESFKATAHRLSADLDMGLHYTNVVRMSKDPSQEREYILRLGHLAEKLVRDIEEALKRPL